MHLAEERIQRLLDGELTSKDEAAARAHLATCAACRSLMAMTEEEMDHAQVLLQALDEPMPELKVETIVRLARENPGSVEAPAVTIDRAAPWRRRPPMLRRAAAFVFAVAIAGAAYAIPGSPLPRWVRGVVQGMRPDRPPAVAPRIEPGEDRAGIAVIPGASLVIEFRARTPSGQVDVILTDEKELVIRAPLGAATFTSDVDRVVVENRGPATFDIQVPRAAPRIEIRVGGVPAFLKEGARVTLAEPVGEGAYRIPLDR